ncbi:predicted protein [Naegleria gruberi]|uniref:Predicted protein n=1 Tax=Naegleria gruberi TaxID=5762 RepID=D2W3L2_NAEGR|nr:uncharacterized protein NAEGRDRAFT_82243 [Naegleria gruberi]EFC36353.1 predicted protein [Naegleria gruberi]|eukprot:XP_002669097.1 predicted protein [Naegleria gruberi strain NEG-M]
MSLRDYPLTALSSSLVILAQSKATFMVGRARKEFHVKPPLTEGPPGFLNALRVQLNGVENIASFLGALWLCTGMLENDYLGGGVGLLYAIGRVWYGYGYPEKRLPGFILCQICTNSCLLACVGLSVTRVVEKYLKK